MNEDWTKIETEHHEMRHQLGTAAMHLIANIEADVKAMQEMAKDPKFENTPPELIELFGAMLLSMAYAYVVLLPNVPDAEQFVTKMVLWMCEEPARGEPTAAAALEARTACFACHDEATVTPPPGQKEQSH